MADENATPVDETPTEPAQPAPPEPLTVDSFLDQAEALYGDVQSKYQGAVGRANDAERRVAILQARVDSASSSTPSLSLTDEQQARMRNILDGLRSLSLS